MIGVFGSGHGGLTVLTALARRFPDLRFAYLGDHGNAPYGAHSGPAVLELTRAGVERLFRNGCLLVIVACNSAAAVALRGIQQDWLPLHHPDRRVLGVVVPVVEAITGVPWPHDASFPRRDVLGWRGVAGCCRYTAAMPHPSRRTTLRTLGLAVLGAATLSGCAAGGGSWAPHRPNSTAAVDHRAWQLFLDRHTFAGADGVTRVAYAEVPGTDRELLDQYIAELERVPVGQLNRAEQLAFWLNLHNALTVRMVLGRLIARSPDEIDLGGGFARGPWTAMLARVAGAPVSLAGIRTTALRPVFKDPRWHYGLCDATLGGPALSRTAIHGDGVDRALEEAAIAYVNHPRAVRVEADGLRLNAFWRRNIEDFGGSEAAVLSHVAAYADRELRGELRPERPVGWMDDRRLNEWPGA